MKALGTSDRVVHICNKDGVSEGVGGDVLGCNEDGSSRDEGGDADKVILVEMKSQATSAIAS